MAERRLRWFDHVIDWTLDRMLYPVSRRYPDGKPLRTWWELTARG